VGLDPSIMTDEIVVNGAVFAVGDYGINALLGSVLVGFNDIFKHLTIINRSGGNLRGGDDLLCLIDRSMRLVAQL
jgi:hypothetical protein